MTNYAIKLLLIVRYKFGYMVPNRSNITSQCWHCGILKKDCTLLATLDEQDDDNIGDMTHNLHFKSPITRMVM